MIGMNWNLSLRTKIIFGATLIVLLLGASVIFFVKTSLAKKLHAEIVKRGVSIAKHTAQGAANFILTERIADLHIMINNIIETEEDINYAFIQGREGEILVHTFKGGFPTDLKNANNPAGGDDFLIQRLLIENEAILDVAAPVLRGQAGIVHLGVSETPVHKAVSKTVGRIIVIVLAILLSGIGIASLFAKRITAPLYELVETAHAVGGGELGRKVRVKAKDEIGKLGSVFNRMTDDLSRTLVSKELLERSYKFKKTILDSMRDAIAIIDVSDHRIAEVNSRFLEELRLDEKDVIGRKCYEITHHRAEACRPPNDPCPMTETAATGDHSSAIHEHYDINGDKLYYEVHTSPIRDENGRVVQVVHISQNITARKNAEERVRFLAYYDGLTGLPNRTFYKELVTRAITYAKRSGMIMATLFVDLDSFKRINDTMGHETGDQLLKTVAERLVKCVRKSDYVARSDDNRIPDTVSRLGGDEFIILLNEVSHGRDAARVARRILSELTRPFTLGGQDVFISASIGIALYPADGEDVEDLLRKSDIAMYNAKGRGKNTYQFYAESMNAAAVKRLALEGELRKALEHDEFLLYYQPKIDARNGRMSGMEALIRWAHPQRGIISPGEFIPVAEDTGLIVPIGEWAIRAACLQSRAWESEGLAVVPIAVNISKKQFEREDMKETVARAVRSADIGYHRIELEVTESMIMQNPETAANTLRALKSLGIRIFLDDFGTGYSSLDYLRKFPLDSLKIDRSFVANITTRPDDVAIASAIIAMAHSLKLKVVAEGVETEEQFRLLQGLGCDEAQGYLFGRPLPAAECVPYFERAFV